MIPIGTRVTVTAVHHDGEPKRPERLIGRTGTVTEHLDGDDCPNVVEGLNRFERFLGVWTFHDDELTPNQDAPPAKDAEDAPGEEPADQVVMRFLTQGGAPVELHTETFRRPFNSRRDENGHWIHDWEPAQGFNWRCTGCHTVGDDYSAYNESKPDRSRDEANAHAGQCRAMPPAA